MSLALGITGIFQVFIFIIKIFMLQLEQGISHLWKYCNFFNIK